jgi:hypothetical protein
MNWNDASILDCRQDAVLLSSAEDARDHIGNALGRDASIVIVSADQCGDRFFDLSSGVAGDIAQKFVNYGIRLIVVGDISGRIAKSTSLRDFVRECNHGRQVWFVRDTTELDQRL